MISQVHKRLRTTIRLIAAGVSCVSWGANSAYAEQKSPAAVAIVPAPATIPPSAPLNPPRCDERCVRSNAEKASAICARKIESQAPGDFEWLSRPFSGIFQQADPSKGEEPIATYRGDSIRFMSPQKDWVRVTYECAFDVEKSVATAVRLRPGRLDKPLAVQPAPPPAQAAQPPIASAPLAAAILSAAKQRSATRAGTPMPPSPPKVGEPSPIDISQVDPNRGSQ
jgi:hypothetical protein